jgi:2-methylcitrate dehydratase PrpD
MHSGWAASSGLTAAQLAASGFTSSDRALVGFYQTYGTAESDLGQLPLGAPYTMESPGIGYKKYACCFAMHRAIDALEQFRAEGLLGHDVIKVTARVAPGSMKPLPYPRPITGFEGKFSMEYALAVGITDGDFSLHGFTDQAVQRPEIRVALERTEAYEDPECSPGDPEGRAGSAGTRGFVEVAIELADGTRHVKQVTLPPGSPQRPMSDDEIREKFSECAEFAGLTDERTSAVLELIEAFQEVPDAAELVRLVTGLSVPVGAEL